MQSCLPKDISASIGARIYGSSRDRSVMTAVIKVKESDLDHLSVDEFQRQIGDSGKVLICVGRPEHVGFSKDNLGAKFTEEENGRESLVPVDPNHDQKFS